MMMFGELAAAGNRCSLAVLNLAHFSFLPNCIYVVLLFAELHQKSKKGLVIVEVLEEHPVISVIAHWFAGRAAR